MQGTTGVLLCRENTCRDLHLDQMSSFFCPQVTWGESLRDAWLLSRPSSKQVTQSICTTRAPLLVGFPMKANHLDHWLFIPGVWSHCSPKTFTRGGGGGKKAKPLFSWLNIQTTTPESDYFWTVFSSFFGKPLFPSGFIMALQYHPFLSPLTTRHPTAAPPAYFYPDNRESP